MKTSVRVNTEKWDELRKRLPEGMHVKVGVLAGAGGEAKHSDSISMIELAAIHEFGSPAANIPERSFIRSTFERTEVRAALNKAAAKAVKVILAGKLTGEQALGQIGAWAANQVKMTIRNRMTTGPAEQALATDTIIRKGSTLPLVDTGRLLGAITWIVEGK